MFDEFEMSDLGKLNYFLGIEFTNTVHGLIMHQTKYARDLLKRFKMQKSNPTITLAKAGQKLQLAPKEESVDATGFWKIFGCLRYLCNTRPNLSYNVGVISRYI